MPKNLAEAPRKTKPAGGQAPCSQGSFILPIELMGDDLIKIILRLHQGEKDESIPPIVGKGFPHGGTYPVEVGLVIIPVLPSVPGINVRGQVPGGDGLRRKGQTQKHQGHKNPADAVQYIFYHYFTPGVTAFTEKRLP